jgi:MFS family permease
MTERRTRLAAVLALGVTQIIGYGTLYYSYALLAPAIAAEIGLPLEWIFGILSAGLLAGALLAPTAGKLADRYGAARLMAAGSAAAAVALLVCAFGPGQAGFALGVLAMELASCFVLYSTAFVALVQISGRNAQKSIIHLTLIAGFASTAFWPLTSALQAELDWREILALFAALHILVCLPLHLWLARISRRPRRDEIELPTATLPAAGVAWSSVFLLALAGFAVEGFVLTAVLVQMVPLLAAVGFGASAVVVGSLFGPSQVASRLINMLFGSGVPQTWLAVVASLALATGLAVLLLTAPSLAGAVAFAILFGMGSGLMSIVGGSLPLELFGRSAYGAYVGWLSAARQFTSAFAPFGLAVLAAGFGTFTALWLTAGLGLAGVAIFVSMALTHRRRVTNGIDKPPTLGGEVV